MNEIDFINAKMNRQNVPTPHFLYKYRPFDRFTFDMLDNAYVYLCPAERLDDPSECKVDFTVQDFYDLKTNRLTFMGVEMILSFIKPYTTEKNFQYIRSIVARALMPQGTVRRHFLLDDWNDIQELVSDTNITPVINWLGNIPDKLNDPNIRYKFIELFSLAHDARRDMGICSLSELNNSDEMWNTYADNSKGYSIEYDMREYENLYAIYPVVYQDNRETNIVNSILSSFIGEMIFGMSNGQIVADRSQFVRLFLTKDLEWSYQKEWRLLGDANQKLSAPTINAIYLGKNMPEHDKQQMLEYCKNHNIQIINPLQGNCKGNLTEAKMEQSGRFSKKEVGRIRRVGRFAHLALWTSGKPAFRSTTNNLNRRNKNEKKTDRKSSRPSYPNNGYRNVRTDRRDNGRSGIQEL